MKSPLLLLGSLLLGASVSFGQTLDPEVHRISEKLQEETRFLNPEYLVFPPASEASEQKVPLVIYLHGAGGVGNEIRKITGQPRGLIRGIHQFEKGPCLVVAPQVLRESPRSDERGTWIAEDLEVFLRHLRKTHPEIDADRIYLTGNSMGGYGSWTWGGHHPEHFAAIAPIVGGIGRGGPKDVTPDLEKWAANLAKVPVFAFAGAQDKVVPAERSKRMVTAIREAGGTRAKIRIYPDEGHGAGRVAFSTPEFFDWMFAQKRGAADSKTEGPKSE